MNRLKTFLQVIITFLDGKKTMIGAFVMAIGGALYGTQKINDQTFKAIQDIGMGISTYGIYAMIKKSLNK